MSSQRFKQTAPAVPVLTKRGVQNVTSLSDSTIRRLELAGDFPRRLYITSRRVVWQAADVQAWLAKRGVRA